LQSKDWRQETAQMLRKLSLRFLEADGSRHKARKADDGVKGSSTVGSGK
jgi:hypothetical protein